MSVRGTDNLRCYLREAILPEMLCHPEAPVIPPHGHKSHLNHLKARPERWRRLECIQPIDSSIMDKRVTDWIDTHIPDTSLGCDDTDHSTGESLTIPCPPVFDIPPHVEMRPTDIFRMVPWLDNLPLMTVQRTLHLIYPRSRHWTFSLQDVANKDCNIFQYFAWTLQAESRHAFEEADEETKRDIGRYSIVLAFQPPWILSYQDLKEFADCRSFPPYLISGNAFPTPLEGKDRLWAKLWDTCAERRTPWFIITSYHYWVFGAFSRGWTTAFVSRVYEYDYYSPTIAECLTYWASSALHIRGTWRIPEVAEPFEDIIRPIHIPESNDDEIPEPAPSESNWVGKNSGL
ncbi:hypothetical protein M378DRAFT_184127 [Amanita muscaria Koide BX008]|uniref:Uncharacterized protein n=1 Tax=Amanita muscaria (strain Koide BX008) TaxID=946122 RepID=A0A0C2T1P0_AMAMK|nr:hypothetical protein M378DRAFT_184127 [Amanita muscaria Koide BX008]